MKAIKKITAAASRLCGRLSYKRSLFALRSEGRRAVYRRLFIIGLILVLGIFIILLPILSANSSQIELLALKRSADTIGPCHETCRQERLLRRERIAASLLSDDKLQTTIASYFETSNLNNHEVNLDFYQELLAIINLAYNTEEPPSFLIDYLVAPEGREEVKVLIIRLILSRIVEPDLIEYYFTIIEGSQGRGLKEEAIRSLNKLLVNDDFLQIQQITRLANLILSQEIEDNLKPSLVFLLTRYYQSFPEIVVLELNKIYSESSEAVIQLLIADLMTTWNQPGYVYPETKEVEWQKYFN